MIDCGYRGEVSEWLMVADSKSVLELHLTEVRILSLPNSIEAKLAVESDCAIGPPTPRLRRTRDNIPESESSAALAQ